MDRQPSSPDSPQAIARMLKDAFESGRAIDEGLDHLLRATGGRAAGLWRLEPDRLAQVGFRAVDDMPLEVRTEFAAATRSVSLDQTGLGIVKAAVARAPTMASVDGVPELGGSAGWLARFECRASLAVPSDQADRSGGVLAISTPGSLETGTPAREILLAVAARLGEALSRRAE